MLMPPLHSGEANKSDQISTTTAPLPTGQTTTVLMLPREEFYSNILCQTFSVKQKKKKKWNTLVQYILNLQIWRDIKLPQALLECNHFPSNICGWCPTVKAGLIVRNVYAFPGDGGWLSNLCFASNSGFSTASLCPSDEPQSLPA